MKLENLCMVLAQTRNLDVENMISSGIQYADVDDYIIKTLNDAMGEGDHYNVINEFIMKNLNVLDYHFIPSIISDIAGIEQVLFTMICNINNAAEGPDY